MHKNIGETVGRTVRCIASEAPRTCYKKAVYVRYSTNSPNKMIYYYIGFDGYTIVTIMNAIMVC